LQNYQLTTELEYQSKQTEKLFFKNQKLIEQVKALKRDVEIHKQVETELAKRSHFCEKLIGKLKRRTQELEEESQELRAEIENNKSNALAHMDTNELKEKRLNIMSNDRASFEEKLAVTKNVRLASPRTTSSRPTSSSGCRSGTKETSRR
jgi:vacuolar-type H+-ATPase subunit I/STV1